MSGQEKGWVVEDPEWGPVRVCDGTRMSTMDRCLRQGMLEHVAGWDREESVHLAFGTAFHAGLEEYERERARGKGHEAGVRAAVVVALRATASGPLTNADPATGAEKTRQSLVRSLITALDEGQAEQHQTVLLPDGSPAVEIHFLMELGGLMSHGGVPWVWSGFIDRIVRREGVELGGGRKSPPQVLPWDTKTTSGSLGVKAKQFNPHWAIPGYMLAVWGMTGVRPSRAILHIVQVQVGDSQWFPFEVEYHPEALADWVVDVRAGLRRIDRAGAEWRWPKSPEACFLCSFKSVCREAPSRRQDILSREFRRREPWDPGRPRTSDGRTFRVRLPAEILEMADRLERERHAY